MHNSAIRFHDLIEKGMKISQKERTGDVLYGLLGLTGGKTQYYREISNFLEIPDIVKNDVLSIPDVNHDLLLTWYPVAKKAADQFNPIGMWGNYISVFGNDHLLSLKFCSEELNKYQPHQEFMGSLESRDKFVADIDELLNEIDTLNLDSIDKKIIQNGLAEIKTAMNKFALYGTAPIEQAVNQAVGSIVTSSKRDLLAKTPVGAKYIAIITLVLAGLSAYPGAKELAADVKTLISAPQTSTKTEAIEHQDENESITDNQLA